MVAALILVWKARRTGSSEKDVVFSVQIGDGNLNTVVRGRHFTSWRLGAGEWFSQSLLNRLKYSSFPFRSAFCQILLKSV